MLCPNCGFDCSKKQPNPEVKKFIAAYHDVYLNLFNHKPNILTRDGVTIKRLFKTHTYQQLVELLPTYFTIDNDFFKRNAYDISRFEKYVNSLKTGATYGSDAVSGRGAGRRLFAEQRAEFRKQRNERVLSRGDNPVRGMDSASIGRGRHGVVDSSDAEVSQGKAVVVV